MAKVFIYPATSLILSDLVARFGHTPLSAAQSIREHIQTAGLESPPLQISPEDPKKGLKYAAVEVPSGVRGRMSLYGPMIEDAEAGDHHPRCRFRLRLHGLCPDERTDHIPSEETQYSCAGTELSKN